MSYCTSYGLRHLVEQLSSDPDVRQVHSAQSQAVMSAAASTSSFPNDPAANLDGKLVKIGNNDEIVPENNIGKFKSDAR